MKNIVALVIITIFTCAHSFAAEKEESKDVTLPLTGEYTPSAGYKIYFDKDKNAFLKLSGFAGFSGGWLIDKDAEPTFNVNYFRWFFDAQSSKKWSLHTRFDYYPTMLLGQSSIIKDPKTGNWKLADDKYTTPGIYFARAYLTFKPSDNIKIDMGRNLIEATRYELNPLIRADVGHGIKLQGTYKDFTGIFQLSYKTSGLRLYPSDPQNGDVWLMGRINYKKEFGKNFVINGGIGATQDTNHHREKLLNVVPDIYITYDKFYIIDELSFMKYSENSPKQIANYGEIGYTIFPWLTADVLHIHEKTLSANKPATNTYGAEVAISWDKNKKLVSSTTYKIVNSTLATPSVKTKTTKLQFYYFF